MSPKHAFQGRSEPTLPTLPAAPEEAPEGRATGVPLAPPQRITEAAMARAVAAWFSGADWPHDDAQWLAYRDKGCAVQLRQEGDRLTMRGHVIAARSPAAVAEPSEETRTAAFGYARAVCRVALRGDHLTLYRG